MPNLIKVVLFLFLFTLSLFGYASTYQGKIIGITDGDTVTLLTANKQQIKIRLDSIDAPEKSQPYGAVSKVALSNLVFGKQVIAVSNKIDKYGRTVATVYLSKINVNLAMVQKGMAWVYRLYARNKAYYTMENYARKYKLGLWSQTKPQAPWDYRKAKLNQSDTLYNPVILSPKDFTCGTKRYCSQMKSGLEAEYYLFQCGVKSLDGDKDGVPCESLK
jgi:endonuclease YncB( thermonuclease family)